MNAKLLLTGLPAIVLAIAVAVAIAAAASGPATGADLVSETFRDLPDPAADTSQDAVANVEGIAITRYQLDGAIVAQRQTGLAPDPRTALAQLIDYEVLYAEGARRGLGPDEAELDAIIAATRESASPEVMKEVLAAAARVGTVLTEEEHFVHPAYREGIRKSHTVANLRAALAGDADRPDVAEARVREALVGLRAAAEIVILDPDLR